MTEWVRSIASELSVPELKITDREFLSEAPLKFSKSNHRHISVWLSLPKELQSAPGVDLEWSSRANPELCLRVASDSELSDPKFMQMLEHQPAWLWCAKEASFKAISNSTHGGDITLLSQISTHWSLDRTLNKHFSFSVESNSSASKPRHAIGRVMDFSGFTLAIAIAVQ